MQKIYTATEVAKLLKAGQDGEVSLEVTPDASGVTSITTIVAGCRRAHTAPDQHLPGCP